MGLTDVSVFSFPPFFPGRFNLVLHRYDVETVVKYGNKIYPASQNAREIVRVFVSYLEDNNVTIKYNTAVNHILVETNSVIGVQTIPIPTPVTR